MDSYKLATALDTTWAKEKGQNTKLKVMAQINTSGEEGWYIDWFINSQTTLLDVSLRYFHSLFPYL